jgi:phenylalanyl-tRNA synthetase beta chain
VRTSQDEGKLPYEQPCFAALIAGPQDEYLTLKPADVDIYDAKAIAIEMVERMTGRRAQVVHLGATERTRHLHPRGAAGVTVDGVEVGVFGPLHPDVLEALDLGESALLVEINLALVEALGQVKPRYRAIPKLPPLLRDLSLVVADATPADQVAETLKNASGELCESVELAAEFRGGSVPEGHRSLTFRVVYRDPKSRTEPDTARTLTDKEVETIQKRALEVASRELGATLRG